MDSFLHTSPEELLAYVGLAPLYLAGMAVVRHWRRDVAVRLLAILFIVTLVLSFGPPLRRGFGSWIKLPGFSFFDAPRVGGLAMSLALALLAGKGFDGWMAWPRPELGVGAVHFCGVVLGSGNTGSDRAGDI